MGFFSNFRKELEVQKEMRTNNNTEKQQQESPYYIKAIKNKEGKIQIDFHENMKPSDQFYDTTRLIIDGDRKDIPNASLKDCRVSWYGEDDAVMFDNKGNEISRRTNYKNVLVDLDLKTLISNRNYCISVMKGLLNEKRVEEYLSRGMQENPDIPCGNYLGRIDRVGNTFKKRFDPNIGRKVHNSIEMRAERRMYQKKQKENKQRAIKEKQEEIANLQSQIDDLSR